MKKVLITPLVFKRSFFMKVKPFFYLIAFISSAFFISTCDNPDISLNEADNNTSLQVETGNRIDVTLVSNATTGFSWEGPEIEGSNIIGEVTSEYITGSNPNLSGQPGHQRFTFTITQSGKAMLTWKYIRPWEENLSQEDIYRITLTTDPVILP